jgi:hypothetical protein
LGRVFQRFSTVPEIPSAARESYGLARSSGLKRFVFHRKGRKGRKENRVLSDAMISLSPSAKSFLAKGFPRFARDKNTKLRSGQGITHTSTP